jgi:hypothetical protein
MNSGDLIHASGFITLLDRIYADMSSANNFSCYYGSSSWHASQIKKRRKFNPNTTYMWPQLGIMPNHQAIVVAKQLCKDTSFDYKGYPIAADLDHKIKLAKHSEWQQINATVCISEADGVSQKMRSLKHLTRRSLEVSRIVTANYSIAHGVVVFALFFIWNFRKLLPTPNCAPR